MSQLLSRLELQLQSTSDPLEIAYIKARKSCYLARTGHFDEARSLVSELRREFGLGENARVSILIMLAEGIIENFQSFGSTSKDRIARSQLIAIAIRDRELGAITSAWKAHADFETSDFKSMGVALRTAIDLADPANHEANSRIALVVSNCMYLYGDREAAQRWFMIGRDHALADGDQAAIDALLFNRAALGISSTRADSCLSEVDSPQLDLLRLEIASAENFTTMTKIVSLNNLIRLSKARILQLMGHYQQALEVLAVVRSEKPFASYNFSEGMVDLERAYCLHKCGHELEAKQVFESINGNEGSEFDIDDRLVMTWTKLRLAEADSYFGDPVALKRIFDDLAGSYLAQKEQLRAIIAGIVGRQVLS